MPKVIYEERCDKCSGTGRLPEVTGAAERILKAANDPNDVQQINGEDEVAWADVLAIIREFKRLSREHTGE